MSSMISGRDTAMLVGAGVLFLVLGMGSSADASAERPKKKDEGDGGDWSDWWDDPYDDGAPGVDVDVSAPKVRPSSPGEIRQALKREPTNEELRLFEAWAFENRELADVILDREKDQQLAVLNAAKDRADKSLKGAAKATDEAAAALRAAQLAAKAGAQPVAPAKQAAGSKLASQLRDLGAPPTADVDVMTAQKVLQKLGEKLKADGAYGPLTAAAWKRQATKRKLGTRFDRVGPKTARIDKATAEVLVVVAKGAENLGTKPAQPKPVPLVPPQEAGEVHLPNPPAADGGKSSLVNLALAKSTADDVAKHIRTKGKKYTTQVVKQFQQRAGLTADGLYGPATASALRYFGANAPAALFKGVNAKYVPPQ